MYNLILLVALMYLSLTTEIISRHASFLLPDPYLTNNNKLFGMCWQSDARLGSQLVSPVPRHSASLSLRSAWYSSLVSAHGFATIELPRRSGLARFSSLQLQINL
jgi:hypothetical protein